MAISNRINKSDITGFLVQEDLITSGDLVSDNLGAGGILTVGEKGIDGYSPVVTIEEIITSEGLICHQITITDAENPIDGQTFIIENGVGIDSVEFNSDYTLTIYFNDGTSYTTGSIRGETGNGIESIEKTDSYYDSESRLVDEYTITLTDGEKFVYYVENGLASTDYNILNHKPTINSVELSGDLNLSDLNIQEQLSSENAGTGISIYKNSEGKTIISNTNVSAEWGNIQGNILEQADLINYIDEHSAVYSAGKGIDITNKTISIKDLILDCGTSTTVI